MNPPTIKPLFWSDDRDDGFPCLVAGSALGQMKITIDKLRFHTPYILWVPGETEHHCGYLEGAKELAFTLHRNRILSFLTP